MFFFVVLSALLDAFGVLQVVLWWFWVVLCCFSKVLDGFGWGCGGFGVLGRLLDAFILVFGWFWGSFGWFYRCKRRQVWIAGGLGFCWVSLWGCWIQGQV